MYCHYRNYSSADWVRFWEVIATKDATELSEGGYLNEKLGDG